MESLSHINDKFYKQALILSIITVFYNIIEGIVSIYFGIDDETIALLGFGVDSFVEVISGIGILHMILRIRANLNEKPDNFEKTALKITGTAFFLLAIGLLVSSIQNLYYGRSPETTFWGIVVSIISLITMWLLIRSKINVGRKLNSQAILADANCTRTCMYLSLVLLLSSLGYMLTGFGGFDSIGALGIAAFSIKEGREAFQKAKGMSCTCGDVCKENPLQLFNS